jgi:hypothetical protein
MPPHQQQKCQKKGKKSGSHKIANATTAKYYENNVKVMRRGIDEGENQDAREGSERDIAAREYIAGENGKVWLEEGKQ